jgi:hypothetical protein
MNAAADPSKADTITANLSFFRPLGACAALVLLMASGVLQGCAATPGGGNEGSGGVTGGDGVGGKPAGSGGASSVGSGGSAPGSGGMVTGTGGAAATGGRTGAGGTVTGIGGATGTGTGGSSGAITAYWVGPSGSDTNPGTEAAPFATVAHAVLFVHAGFTIWILPGTYAYVTPISLGTSGTSASVINLFAAPGTRPVLDFAQQKTMTPTDSLRGFNVSGDYWHLRGFEVKNAADNCINISGSHNTLEDVITDFCGDTGIQITVGSAQASDATRGASNLILNCDSHDNFDVATGGENADGIDAKLNIGPGNIFRGCRSWNNSDDGYDLFGVVQPVTIDNCWAMLNGHTTSGQKGPAADGNGFKLGGNNTPAVHVVTSSFSMNNDTCGFTLNNNASQPRVTACGVNGNKSTWCDGLQHSGDVTITMTGAQAIAAQRVTNAAAGASTLPAIH